jgi:hypothetical protein
MNDAQVNNVRKETIKIAGLEHTNGSRWSCAPDTSGFILDDSHFLISKQLSCGRIGQPIDIEWAVADIHGQILAKSHQHQWKNLLAGPDGQLIVSGNGSVEILNHQFQPITTLKPRNRDEWKITLSPSRNAVSICSGSGGLSDQAFTCTLFAGTPISATASLSSRGPFPGLNSQGFATIPPKIASQSHEFYHPADDEIWFFNHKNLLYKISNQKMIELPDSQWLSLRKNDDCSIQMSAIPPRRVLAQCSGSLDLFGGDEMPIFPYQRVIVYSLDGHILLKKNVHPFGEVSISPNGCIVAVSHGDNFDLYSLPK